MIAEEAIDNHPLRLLDAKTRLPEAELSVVLARSGVGKTAALVNFGLDTLLKGKKVLHFSVGMDSEKVHEYYQEIFQELTREMPEISHVSWQVLNQQLLVISYQEVGKMIAELDNELKTLENHAHVSPALLIIDGLDAAHTNTSHLKQFRDVARGHGYTTLASLTIHRHTDGTIDLDTPLSLLKSQSSHVYYLEPTATGVKLDFASEDGMVGLPIYLCPHNLIFKKES